MFSRILKGPRIFLVAGWLPLFSPLAVYGQDASCKQLEEKVRMLEKTIEELEDANAMLMENLSTCTEENVDLSEKLNKAGVEPAPVKSK